MKFKEIIYDNGTHLFYQKNKINGSTVIEIVFDCGSRCDGDKPGLAHFCEHMFFTGTKTEDKKTISKQYFDFINTNAFTNSKTISFVGTVFTKEFKDYLKQVEKMINKSIFRKKAVEEEKQVVLQEIVRDSDNYRKIAARKLSFLMYGKKFYLDGALGSAKSVKSIESKDVKAFVKKYFISNNCNIFISSPLSFAKVKKLVYEFFASKLRYDKTFEPMPYDSDKITDNSIADLTSKKIEKNILNVSFKADYTYYNFKDLLKMSALTRIVGDLSDGIFKTIRLEKGLVYSANNYYDSNKFDSCWMFETELGAENIKPCIEALAEYIDNLKNNGIKKEQLDKYKREIRYSKETYTPRPSVWDLIEYRRTQNYVTAKQEYKMISKLTLNDVNEAVHKFFDNPRFICTIYGNAKKEQVFTLKELKNLFKA